MDKNSKIKIVAKNYYNNDAAELEKNILASVRRPMNKVSSVE